MCALRYVQTLQYIGLLFNTSVHVLMYYYYYRRVMGLDVWWKRYGVRRPAPPSPSLPPSAATIIAAITLQVRHLVPDRPVRDLALLLCYHALHAAIGSTLHVELPAGSTCESLARPSGGAGSQGSVPHTQT